MSNSIMNVTPENVQVALAEVQEAFFDIPFGNSEFQTDTFVVASQITPSRAYRAVGLALNSKLQAVLEHKYNQAKEDIDIEELEAKISNPETSKFDRRRAELDIRYKLENRKFAAKLLNDAMVELNVLYSHFKALPKFTREEFEASEEAYFVSKLGRDIQGITGAAESMLNITQDVACLQRVEQEVMAQLK